MIELSPIVAFALVALLAALAVALFALWRLHRGVRAPIRRMLDAVAAGQQDEAAPKPGVSGDMQRLEEAFNETHARLKAQEATLDQAFEIAGLGTWAILPDLDSVRASSHIRMILGFSEDDDVVRLDELRDRIVPEDRAAFAAALRRATNERILTALEFRAVDAAGEVRVFQARTGPGGAVPRAPERGVSGIIQDITELRHKEMALARSSRLERLAGEAARVGGWRYDVATRMFTGTQETAKIVGREADWHSSIDDAMDGLVTGDDRARMERSFWTCVGTGTRFDEIAKFKKFDGDEIWLRVIGEAERDASGKIVATYGATQDVSELVCARVAVDDVRALMQTILDDLSDGFIIHDRDGEIRYMNRRAHSILGVPDLNLIDRNIWRDLPLAAESPFARVISAALETGESQKFEGELSTPDQWVNVMVHPTNAGIAIYLNDVTADREARTRLRLLDAAVARVSDVILITEAKPPDMPGPRVVFANEAFEQVTGYSQDDILGSTPRMLHGPDTERERLREIRKAMKTAQPIRTEITNYRKDGSRFTAELDINPLLDDAGKCTHFVSVQRDTTERRKAEEYLRAREEQFRLASQASRDIIWDWDMHTGIIWNSENSEEIFGTISQSHVGTIEVGHGGNSQDGHIEKIPEARIENVLERVHPDDRLKVTESLDAALGGDAQTWRCEYRIRTQEDAWRHISDKAFIVRDDDGAPRRMVGAMSDVTEFQALDAQLHQAQKLETVGQLTGGIAHDFNNLITIILGNCDILLDDIGEEPALRPMLQSIEDAAERAARVSSDLLAFSRIQSLELQPTDINKLIQRSSGLFERAIDASVDIRYDLTDAPTVARVDPNKLQAALLNLIINAKAAIPEDGHITLVTRAKTVEDVIPHSDVVPGDYVLIDVTDDGAGMSPEVAGHAFEPFFTTKEPGVGTGMGLSSVYGLVKQCGGHAEIVSEPGKGTTVTLSLPVADEVEPAPPPEALKESGGGGGERILVVEDDAELRAFVKTVLSRMGYRIVEAENGQIALDILKEDDGFDLLFTDIVMPGGVTGVEVAQTAQDMHPGFRVLFTSGYAQDALPKERHVPSDVPMLYKPYRASELIKSVKDILSKEVPRGF
ncbi:hybrid sensor histidine kinase/response regulator [Roseovarius nitratireducens]|uniref:hybrid sensor histidine kinase/response regulator n=1 Tax=Roseovarius nitratireducens TaxID=2044597 RepID=UPI000CE18C24|nr:PAS domain-containing protein [Roseovarius nitratireducens]